MHADVSKSDFSGFILTSGRLHVPRLFLPGPWYACLVSQIKSVSASTLSQSHVPPPPPLIELRLLKYMQIGHALLEKPEEEALVIFAGQKVQTQGSSPSSLI